MDSSCDREKEADIYEEFLQPLAVGETWYLISKNWVDKWKSFAIASPSNGEHPGPIDNSRLFEENSDSVLRKFLIDEEDYYQIPENVWKKLVELYNLGDEQKPISRTVIETGVFSKQLLLEIYPPLIKMKQHGSDEKIVEKIITRCTTLKDVHEKMREIFDISSNQKTRVYIQDSNDTIKEANTLDESGIGSTQVLVLERQNNDETWPRSSGTLSTYDQATASTSGDTKKKTNNPSTTYNKYNGSNNHSTRSTANNYYSSKYDKPGVCGLSNLGNTCFMNSAVQCLSNVPSLTMYFQEKNYIKELNEDNPIGMHGKLAMSYAELIHNIWSGKHSSVSPREFKYNVSSFAPQFSGYQQHDSQELLAFLIDGLHEDLNRIEKKPYIELKDSGGRPDEEVAREAWTNHLQRNDSIIVDMFHGLFKSTIICPTCGYISITFDPFGYVSLPLPRRKDMPVLCSFLPRDASKPVTKHTVMLPKDGQMKDLCTALANKTGCKEKNLVVTDVYNHRFYKIYKNSEKIARNYSERDHLFVFELGFDEDDDTDKKPEYACVYMRQEIGRTMRLFAHPFLIPVKSGVTTYRKFYNTVLSAVSRYVKQEFKDNVKMLSELKKCELNESVGSSVDGNGTSDNEEEQDAAQNEEEEIHWFKLITTNTFGTIIYKELDDSDGPLKFSSDKYFSAEWDSNTCEEYAVEDWYSTFEDDASMKEQPLKERGTSVHQCMELFTTKEKLGEDDEWYCPSCKDQKQATKEMDLWSLPPVLIVHLKRFSHTRWTRDKIGTYVDFPIKDLDLSEFIVNPNKERLEKEQKMYNLIGVSNHYGSMGGGHYTAYARNYMDNKWYYFDDSSVTQSSEDKVKTKAAYMLMYQRQDMEKWIDKGEKGPFNFLESMVSPRCCNEGFAYEENAKMQKKQYMNGNENSSKFGDSKLNGIEQTEAMDTS